jgi:branched-chain amino acid transport system substrate-binding protein
MLRKILLASTLILSLAVSIQCTKKAENEILVGEFGSLTGSEATFGVSTNKGIKLAFDEINAAGGINGKKIKLITLDDQGKAEEAAQAVTRLITQDKVVAILGEVASTRSLAAAPIAQQYKVPMISPSSTNPKVTEIGDYIFRVCFIDPFQGTVMAKFAVENLKVKKVAILRDVKSDYSMGLADYFASKVKELGGEIISDVSYASGDNNFKAQLTKIKASAPEAIFIPGYYTEVGLIAKQAKELGMTMPLLGGDGWDSSKLSEIGGEAINGHYFSNHYTTESKDTAVVDFITKFKAKYNETPDGLAALGYDAAKILTEAIKKVKEPTGPSIRDELAKVIGFDGVTGKITIDDKRNAVKSAVVVKVEGKDNKFVTTITP